MWWDIVKVSTIQQIKQMFKQAFGEHVKIFNFGMVPIPEFFEGPAPIHQRRKSQAKVGRIIMALIKLHSSKINYPEDEQESYSTIVIVEITKNDDYIGYLLSGNHAETINLSKVEMENIITSIRNVSLDRIKTWVKNIKQEYFSIQAHIQSFDKPLKDDWIDYNTMRRINDKLNSQTLTEMLNSAEETATTPNARGEVIPVEALWAKGMSKLIEDDNRLQLMTELLITDTESQSDEEFTQLWERTLEEVETEITAEEE
jgi:hypothetical protein